MFVDDDVEVAFPPLPLPLDWSSRMAVSGMSSMMSPPAIDGMAAAKIARSVKTVTRRKGRLATEEDIDDHLPLRGTVRPLDGCSASSPYAWLAGEDSHGRQIVSPAPERPTARSMPTRPGEGSGGPAFPAALQREA